MEQKRQTARQLAKEFLNRNEPLNWFETLYELAEGNEKLIPWADMTVNPNLASWLQKEKIVGNNGNALIIGCGLGDDAEAIAKLGFKTIAFDIAETAIAWCKKRFPDSSVKYTSVDLFASPASWQGSFDFVLQIILSKKRHPCDVFGLVMVIMSETKFANGFSYY
ncbi:MAG: methyltransferase domain-containing protein [Cyanobacteria bacterium P01_E01_bin.42]